jgi:hypothetical protein
VLSSSTQPDPISANHGTVVGQTNEFQFRFLDHSGPTFVTWLRSHGIRGRLRRGANSELVGFDLPPEWSVEETEAFARQVVERVTEEAISKLARLRSRTVAASPWSQLAVDLRRIADHFEPPPPDKVGTEYVAERLGCTTTWIADLVRREEIPSSCLVRGTGNGKPWKFHRWLIDGWIESR